MALQDCSAAQAGDLMRQAAESNGEQLITTAERILSTVSEEPEVASTTDRQEL